MRDIIEVRRICGIAVSGNGRTVGFLVEQSLLETGDVHYALYVARFDTPGTARKLTESRFMADLAAHPHGEGWTVRADMGEGIQLYGVDERGVRPLVVVSSTARIGTWDGVLAGLGAPRRAGVISYEWAPDGSALWYSRLRLRAPEEWRQFVERGIVYDDSSQSSIHFRNEPGLLLGTELRLFEPNTGVDRLLAFVPASASTSLGSLRRDWATALWSSDSRHVLYARTTLGLEGEWITRTVRVDARTGDHNVLADRFELDMQVPSPDGKSRLTVKVEQDGTFRLYEVDPNASEWKQLGEVDYQRIGMGIDLGAWRDPLRRRTVMAVHYASRDGLVTFPESPLGRRLSTVMDNLSHCSFARDLKVGACVRESVTLPPELVAIHSDGSLSTLVRPNKQYDDIERLHFEHFTFRNSYGSASDGYITYPRGYQARTVYPSILITHARDARNRFADPSLQWDFPLQVMAERGYLVLSVNEPFASFSARTFFQDDTQSEKRSELQRVQFNVARDAVAAMEAAITHLVATGKADPRRTAIAGFSRGAEVAAYTMSQSSLFKAAVLGDGGANADGYWAWGNRVAPLWFNSLYGGSPYSADSTIRANYEKLAPAFRAEHFAGPVLQIFPQATTQAAFELHRALRDARVPTELVYFPNEGHLFWHPRHRLAAMERTLDWLDFWLRGKDPTFGDPNSDQLRRWRSMRDEYSHGIKISSREGE